MLAGWRGSRRLGVQGGGRDGSRQVDHAIARHSEALQSSAFISNYPRGQDRVVRTASFTTLNSANFHLAFATADTCDNYNDNRN